MINQTYRGFNRRRRILVEINQSTNEGIKRERGKPSKALLSCSASSSGRGTLAGTLREAIFEQSEISV